MYINTSQSKEIVAILSKAGLNNDFLRTLADIVNNIVQHCYTLDSGSTILFNIVDKYLQCSQQNFVQLCDTAISKFSHEWSTGIYLIFIYGAKQVLNNIVEC